MRFSDLIRRMMRIFVAGFFALIAADVLCTREALLYAHGAAGPPSPMEQAQDAIRAGVDSYQEGLARNDQDVSRVDFQRAAASFLNAVERMGERSNLELYRNLGHAAAQSGDRGLAIWSYRQALGLAPDNSAIQENLESLRSELPGWARTPKQGTASFVDRGLEYFGRWWGYAIYGFPAFAIFLSLFILTRRSAMLYLALALLGLGTIGWWHQTYGRAIRGERAGVVVTENLHLRVADSPRAAQTIRQPIPSGTEVGIVGNRSDWLQVILPQGEKGWLPAEGIREVTTPVPHAFL
jgi:tetratricopeptide (TPR) repeat protein